MVDLAFLVPVLLVMRIVLDLATLIAGRITYHLEFAYFALFLAAGMLMFKIEADGNLWAWLSLAVATYSLVAGLIKYSRRQPSEPKGST